MYFLFCSLLFFKAFLYLSLFFAASAIFIARTFRGRPNRVMKPEASWWSYRSPVVKEARDSLYRL